jgi:hypothetical protein
MSSHCSPTARARFDRHQAALWGIPDPNSASQLPEGIAVQF